MLKFVASHLAVRDVPAAVHIRVHRDQQIAIDLPHSIPSENLLIERIGMTLSVRGASLLHQARPVLETETYPGISSIISADASPAVGNENQITDREDGPLLRRMTQQRGAHHDLLVPVIPIDVPLKTSVALSGVAGQVVIGDTDGLIFVVTSPLSRPIRVGRVSGGTVVVQGNGRVAIADIIGERASLQLVLLGMGQIVVERGNIDLLSAAIQGPGYIAFGGMTSLATLVIKGTGTIEVAKCASLPLCLPGNGTIRVGDALFR